MDTWEFDPLLGADYAANLIGSWCICSNLTQIAAIRDAFFSEINASQFIRVYPSEVNYGVCKWTPGSEGPDLNAFFSFLNHQRIHVRECDSIPGMPVGRCFRVAVRKPEENERFLEAIHAFERENPFNKGIDMKSISILGTTSDAGKSWLNTAFCALMRKHGVNVAPFKAQNMSNNSFVTLEGGEIGRAQAAQAEACGLRPVAEMKSCVTETQWAIRRVRLCS